MYAYARVFLLALLLVACSPAEPEADGLPFDSLAQPPPEPTSVDYEVYLLGATPDTLRGAAHFGDVVDARTGQTLAVIRLETSFDFGGGFFLTYGAPELPGVGQYPIEAFPPDSLRDQRLPQGFSARYRRGLLINLRATGGTLTLESTSDSLITGRFEADLAGLLALPGGTPREGTLRAVGTFSATATGAGYIIGF